LNGVIANSKKPEAISKRCILTQLAKCKSRQNPISNLILSLDLKNSLLVSFWSPPLAGVASSNPQCFFNQAVSPLKLLVPGLYRHDKTAFLAKISIYPMNGVIANSKNT